MRIINNVLRKYLMRASGEKLIYQEYERPLFMTL